jgi:hypothetical protein
VQLTTLAGVDIYSIVSMNWIMLSRKMRETRMNEKELEETREILDLVWDLECGLSWYDVPETREKLEEYYTKYKAGPYRNNGGNTD